MVDRYPVAHEDVSYFKSKTDEILFYIFQLSGEAQHTKLGIQEYFYHDKYAAKEWYVSMKRRIDPSHHESLTAYQRLYRMYDSMINNTVPRYNTVR
jgi:hypothetical protein